jgi:septal ring factor EnvC (AmiA/AmiB activator)
MQQQINLFQPVFRREAKVFSARTLAQVLILALVLIVAGVALLQLQLGRHTATRTSLDGQYRALESQLGQLEAQADTGQLAELDARIKTLETQLADGSAELGEIQQQVVARSRSLAPLFTALARHPLQGLWLTGIHVRDDTLELTGTTLNPELLPRYLAQLSADADLAPWSLTTVQLERSAEIPGQVQFTLSSSERELTAAEGSAQ